MRYLKPIELALLSFPLLIGLTLLAFLLYFVGVSILMLAAPFSNTARKGLSDLARGHTA